MLIFIIAYCIYKFLSPVQYTSTSANNDGLKNGQISDLKCMRCFDSKMIYNGTERFHVGSNAAPFLFGNLGELFVDKQTFDVYYCPVCGKVEFFFRKKD